MRRNVLLLAGIAAGTACAFLLRRRGRGPDPFGEVDPRAEELRRKLAQAREEAADEDEFEAAGMGAETLVEDEPPQIPAGEDVDAERRRVHEDARAAADEMRQSGSEGD